MIKNFDSISELRAEWLAKGRGVDGGRTDNSGNDWYGYENGDQTRKLSETGDTRLVADAEQMIAQITTAIEVPRKQVFRTVAGGWPSVPDAIAGLPLCMRRMGSVNDEHAPITILADTSSSAGIGANTLKRRGCAILALVMELSKVRPITLLQVTTMGTGKGDSYGSSWTQSKPDKSLYASHDYDKGEVILTARINTTPLDLATAAYVLTSQSFSRRLTYETTYGYGANGTWPTRYNKFGKDLYAKYITETVGLDPLHTLYVEAPHLHDEVIRDPVAWIERQIKRFTETVEEEAA